MSDDVQSGAEYDAGKGGGNDYTPAPSYLDSNAAVPDYSYASPDLGNLDYLSGGSGTPIDTGTTTTDGGGAYIDPGSGGSGIPNIDLGGGGFGTGGGAGGIGTDVLGGGTSPVPSQPGNAFSADAFTYGGPAGSSSVPNATALNENVGQINSNPMASLANFNAAPGGPSAAGDSFAGASGGSGGGGDLSAKKDPGFFDKLTSNPLGTAIAGAGLAYNIFKGNEMNKALQGPTGQSPSANLADLAAPAMQTGRELTDEGRGIARTGVDDLRTRAATTDPNSQTLINRGTDLTGYVGTGKLPPEMQAAVDQAAGDAKTARYSFYAAKGMPVDPTKNSSLRSDLERIDQNAIIQGATLASQLAQTGTGIVTAGSGLNQISGGFERSAADIGQNFITSGIASSNLAGSVYNNLARIDNEQTERTQKAIAAMAAALSGQSISNSTSNLARTV